MTDSDSDEISSLLSNNQRDWLRGDDDALGSPDRVIRSRIKKRVRQGISDLGVVFRSDRLSSEDVMKAVREESTSSSEAGQQAGSGGVMSEDMQPDAYDSALTQLEMVSGTKAEDFDMTNLISQIRRVQGQHGHVDEETVEFFAYVGAVAGVLGTGKTTKQARQWVEHHWPESDDVLEDWDQITEFIDD